MDKKYKVVSFIGESASGKDTIVNKLCERLPRLNKKVSTTTRPSREGEEEGRDYFFISEASFTEKVLNYEMIEAVCFRDWFYGTELKAFKTHKINVGIFNPEGIEALLENPKLDVLVFYITASDKIRIMRSLSRETNPDIEETFRRYKADKEDFSSLDFDYVKIVNDGEVPIDNILDAIQVKIAETFGCGK